ncbi:MAG: DUF3990 domain-containing protein [Coriobacteriales bacterium]|jgi:hypothetical protein|nr:DUF3990 domain-containing protein [Coriobacteriales bacterium]
MRLYHGSNMPVQFPEPDKGRAKLDFGKGFYVTTNLEQAQEWAIRTAKQRKALGHDGKATVSEYEYNDNNNLIVKQLSHYNEEWLFFVCDNRRSDYPIINHGYDVIFGHIADDRVIETIDYFIEQLISGNASKNLVTLTIEQLKKQTPNDQACFTNRKALEQLTFIKSYEVQ